MYNKINFFWSLFRSWKSSRKIIVIESDDWGSERIPNKKVKDSLSQKGINMESNPHSKYDTLEQLEDLEVLEHLLEHLYSKYQKRIKITPNFITANPDFDKIRETKFTHYFFEPFTNTYKNRDGHDKVATKLQDLINCGFFQPQFHGREHINVSFWLEELKRQNKDFLEAFNEKCYAIDAPSSKKSKNLMAALDYENEIQLALIKNSISEGHELFKSTFGFSSDTFIAPRYTWNDTLNETFVKEKFKVLQSALYQQSVNGKKVQRHVHYTGQVNKSFPLRYTVRNVFFEPAYGNIDWVNAAFKKIELAFRFCTPALISMHRINFVGGLDPVQREENLKQFNKLLSRVIRKYPKVEFLSSDELVKLI